jgi:hypothetical protein
MEELTTVSGLPAPAYWSLVDIKRDEQGVYAKFWQRLQGEAVTVIETIAPKGDGKNWLHVSIAKPNQKKLPSWEDIQTLKHCFIGDDRECYMVFPTKDRYINFFDVLHLFCCLDEPTGVLPHMEGFIEGLGLSV